jgi:hypothetical protein
MFESLFLEKEQKELLVALVEASRNVQSDPRRAFILTQGLNEGDRVRHPGLPGGNVKIYLGDLRALADAELLIFSQRDMFDLHQRGFQYYEHLKRQTAAPIRRVETEITGYLATERFRKTYAEAYQKWSEAEAMLWKSDSESQFTTIGHLCSEALQEFTDTLIRKFQPPKIDPDKSHTVSRLRAVIDLHSEQLGDKIESLLHVLVTYWGTVSDVVQRQEHGAAKEKEPLVWEDGRRVVFQTLIVMYEIDRALLRH